MGKGCGACRRRFSQTDQGFGYSEKLLAACKGLGGFQEVPKPNERIKVWGARGMFKPNGSRFWGLKPCLSQTGQAFWCLKAGLSQTGQGFGGLEACLSQGLGARGMFKPNGQKVLGPQDFFKLNGSRFGTPRAIVCEFKPNGSEIV